MSYSRWSTPLGLDTRQATGETDPTESSIAWHSMSQADRMAELNRQGAIVSEWYIYGTWPPTTVWAATDSCWPSGTPERANTR